MPKRTALPFSLQNSNSNPYGGYRILGILLRETELQGNS